MTKISHARENYFTEPAAPRIEPLRALLHPAWLGALALLVLNDHLFKHSVYAGLVTGKLSDFAGLFLAPVLLAALLRVRSRRGLVGCGVAVGVVFAGINLSAGLARLWDGVASGFLFGFHTTPDATDLVALPMIALGLIVLYPRMCSPWPSMGERTRRRLACVAVIVGSIACMATGEPIHDGANVGWTASARVSIFNRTNEIQVLRVRYLREEFILDCGAVRENPAAYLADEHFGNAAVERMMSGQEIAVDLYYGRDRDGVSGHTCKVALVQSDKAGEVFVIWDDQLAYKDVLGDVNIPRDVMPDAQTVVLDADYAGASGPLHEWRNRPCYFAEDCSEEEFLVASSPPAGTVYRWWSQHSEPLHRERPAGAGPLEGASQGCFGPTSNAGVDWDRPPSGEWTVQALEEGEDGCSLLQLASLFGAQSSSVRVCAPEAVLAPLWPTGNEQARVSFREEGSAVSSNRPYFALRIELQRVVEERIVGLGSLHLVRGVGLPQDLGISLLARPRQGCEPALDSCMDVERGLELEASFRGETRRVREGQSSAWDGTIGIELHVARARERFVSDDNCLVDGSNHAAKALGVSVGTAVLVGF
ncbi:MAG: hypothetical protein H0U74_05095 [Bradymonadaceae bacterium]|nr:hypothetical protein [Lujinxingiaceae bacterium]